MPRHVAFLRAVNVGGRTVKSAQLVDAFGELGLSDVSTFLASGNVLFAAAGATAAQLEARIERGLREALGWDVDTFVRSASQLTKVARSEPFGAVPPGPGATTHVVFLKRAPSAAAKAAVAAASNEHDRLQVRGREIWWRINGGMMSSTVDWKPIEQALGRTPTTARNLNTVRRLADRLAG